MTFQVGDIVERINDDFRTIKVGDIGEVSYVINGDIRLVGHASRFTAGNFVLVSNTKLSTLDMEIRALKTMGYRS